jgi:DNA repair protein RadD
VIIDRPYQIEAARRVHELWADGVRRVCLVAPTGSGKTHMATMITEGERVLFIAHRTELVSDKEKISGSDSATIQELSCSGRRPDGYSVIVVDECHTVGFTPEWRKVLADYPSTRILGLTATPERADGSGLGDCYDQMVVAARYSDLIASGHIVPCRVFAPHNKIKRGIAKSITKAFLSKASDDAQGLVYCSTIDQARSAAADMRRAGVSCEAIWGEMPPRDRDSAIDGYRRGAIRVLTNVFVLTEGVNFPNASVCVIARGCDHVGTYMQIVGRVLRAAPGKKESILVDLTGVSITHGSPTQDRIYSLEGKPIRLDKTVSVTTCLKCGMAFVSRMAKCPSCGAVHNEGPPRPPTIRDEALRLHYRGDETPDELKEKEWDRLVVVAKGTRRSLSWALTEYRKLFPGSKPKVTSQQIKYHTGMMIQMAKRKGYKAGYAFVMVKDFKSKVEVMK